MMGHFSRDQWHKALRGVHAKRRDEYPCHTVAVQHLREASILQGKATSTNHPGRDQRWPVPLMRHRHQEQARPKRDRSSTGPSMNAGDLEFAFAGMSDRCLPAVGQGDRRSVRSMQREQDAFPG